MNWLNFYMNSDYWISLLSSLPELLTSVNIHFYQKSIKKYCLPCYQFERRERTIISKGNDSIQVTFKKEEATKAEAGSPAIIITTSGHIQMVP